MAATSINVGSVLSDLAIHPGHLLRNETRSDYANAIRLEEA